jgi:hypothetical protein
MKNLICCFVSFIVFIAATIVAATLVCCGSINLATHQLGVTGDIFIGFGVGFTAVATMGSAYLAWVAMTDTLECVREILA